jgi:hypothetical protein
MVLSACGVRAAAVFDVRRYPHPSHQQPAMLLSDDGLARGKQLKQL